jgi:NAD(P)-dependent dehydrogenase (short-subunit alcohol dehydrogenase family)
VKTSQNMSALLSDRTAVVTGGSSGNGRAISLRFAEEGANVVVADIRDTPRQGGDATHEKIPAETDAQAAFVECDVTNVDDFEAAMAAADEFGGVDIMVNNAGIFRSDEFTEITEDEYNQTMDVNVKGVFFGAQAAANRMLDAERSGSIVNLSSVAGLRGSGDFVTYCTSKGAIRLLTYSLAEKLGADGIRVNAIHPGLIETEMTTGDVPIFGGEAEEEFLQRIPSQRKRGQPEDVAKAALFLASDLADYVNGESLLVDGGMSNTQ